MVANPAATSSDVEPATDWLTAREATAYLGCKTARTVRNLFFIGVGTPRGRITLRFQRVSKVMKTRVAWVGEYLQRVKEAFEDPVPVARVETPTQKAKRFAREKEEMEAMFARKRRAKR